MKKPDFSKQALSKFFLHHTEKLVLGLCLIMFGVFFWMGWKKTPFNEVTPSELVNLANQAENYMLADNWELIKPHRVGNPNVLDDILKAEGEGKLKPTDYIIDLLSGIPAKTLDARQDPVIQRPTDLRGFSITAPVMIAMSEPFKDAYLENSPVSVPDAGGFGGGLGGGRPGGFGGEEGDDDDMEGDYEEGDEEGDEGLGGLGGPGGGRGGGLGGFGGDAEDEDEEEEKIPVVDAGQQVTVVNSHTMPGVRSMAFGIPASTTKPWLLDVVCITAVVDFQKQFQSYEAIFPGAIGYYPDRDKPIYQHVEVQRRKVGAEKWDDRTEWVQFNLPKMYPAMHKMPKAFNSTAPDITHPENWDPVLTGPIPPFAMFDYQDFVSHPLLAGKERTFPEPKEVEEMTVDEGSVFGDPKKDDKSEGGLGSSSGGGLGGLGGGRGGGLGGLGGGRGGGLGGGGLGGLGGGGLGGLGGGGGLGGLGGTRGDGAALNAEQSRLGTDFTDYLKALDAKKPNSKHKLVRFFDVDPKFKSGDKYEYRIRVWLGDPNNEDPSMEFVNAQGGAAKTGGFGGGMGPGGMDDEGEYEDEEDEEDEEGDGDENEGDEQTAFKKTPILSTMKVPAVRQRLNKATAVVNEKTDETEYTISEPRTKKVKNAEGVEEAVVEYETIKIPSNRAYLRFARPSEWSDSTQVTIESETSLVAAGDVVPSKKAKIKVNGEDVMFPISEPAAEMVASEWSEKYGTAIPSKQTVYRGDLMNYFTAAHIMNPITWRVYLTKNSSELAEEENKYRVPVRTQKVLVDSLGGDTLPLPRTEKMRHDRVSEFLVMDESGNFKVHNDLEDRTTYRNLLLLPDEQQTVGRGKKKKKEKENDSGGGGLGGLGGFGDNR